MKGSRALPSVFSARDLAPDPLRALDAAKRTLASQRLVLCCIAA